MSFLGKLGIDPWLLLAQIVNFAILIFILKKFLYKPIIDRIEEGEATLSAAEHAKAEQDEREKAFAKKEKQLTTRAKNKAEKIVSEAEDIAHDIRERAAQEAAAEKDAVIAQVRQRLSEIEEHGAV